MRAGLVLAALIAGPAAAAPSPWLAQTITGMDEIHGRYANVGYGFSVDLPPAAAAYVAAAPNPNHGVVIVLGEQRTIRVYAYYTAVDAGERPCVNVLPHQRDGARFHGTAIVGGRAACSVTQTGSAAFDQVQQVVGADRGARITYTLWLATTPAAKDGDMATFRRVGASFTRIPVAP